MRFFKLKASRYHRFVGTATDEGTVRTLSQHQGESAQNNGFSCSGLPGQDG
jgi:hypothetical protein